MLILDCLVEVLAPFDTSQAVAHVAETLKAYGCRSTMGDDHAKGWVRSELARHGITLEPRPPRMDGSVFHLEILPSFSSGRVRLLKNARAIAQYCGLERRPRGDREHVGHATKGAHDDLTSVISGALWRARSGAGSLWRGEHLRRAVALPARNVLALYCVMIGNGRGELAYTFFQEALDRGKIVRCDAFRPAPASAAACRSADERRGVEVGLSLALQRSERFTRGQRGAPLRLCRAPQGIRREARAAHGQKIPEAKTSGIDAI
jgi:hypothetical protein